MPGGIATLGMQALAEGAVAVVSLAGGVGSRWTKGAGVVKALNPFCKLGGRHRNFIEMHLAKSLRVGRECGTLLPHVVTTSYLTHDAIEQHLARESNYGYPGPLLLSPGRIIGLRMIPMERDLRFAWEEMPQQMLDEQAQKVRESLHAALIDWARAGGRGRQLHRQPADAVPASGGPLVRSAQPAAQRHAAAPARGAPAPELPDGAQHRYRGGGCRRRRCSASTSRAARP